LIIVKPILNEIKKGRKLKGSLKNKYLCLDFTQKTEEYKTILAVCTGSINLNW